MGLHFYILLGLQGIPLRYSLAVSLPTTGLYVCGFVLTGGAIFEGKTGLLILGFTLLLATSVAVHILRQRLTNRGALLRHIQA